MKIIAAIPARIASSRFPKKMLANLGGLPVISQTYLGVRKTNLFDEIIVATDNDEIEDAILKQNGKVFRSLVEHPSGTDRIAEATQNIDADIIINIQGDEPFVQKETLLKVIQCFEDKNVAVASAMQQIENLNQIQDPNFVKVITDTNLFALYFSRLPIPYERNKDFIIPYYEHIGIYGFTKQCLQKFAHHGSTPLETKEQIEAIRFLEMGLRMKMAVSSYMGIEIDTIEDLEMAQKKWQELS